MQIVETPQSIPFGVNHWKILLNKRASIYMAKLTAARGVDPSMIDDALNGNVARVASDFIVSAFRLWRHSAYAARRMQESNGQYLAYMKTILWTASMGDRAAAHGQAVI